MKMVSAKIEDIAVSIRTGKTPPSKKKEYFGGNVLWYTPGDIDNRMYLNASQRTITDKALADKKAVEFSKSTVLITCIGNIGNVGISYHDKCSSNQQITGITTKPCVIPEYFFYWIRANRKILEHSSNNAVVPILNNSSLKKIQIKYPSIKDQNSIVNVLNEANSLRQKRKESIKLLDDFLRSTFLEMFGDPFNNPKRYSTKKIKDLGSVITGNTPSRKKKEYYGNFIEWIKSDNINTPEFTLTKAEEYLSKEGAKVGRIAPRGSVLVSCIAGSPDCIGNIAIADREVTFNQQINAFISGDSINNKFFFSQILFCKKLVQQASTNGMKGLVSKSRFENIKIIVPPKQEQDIFANILEKIDILKYKMQTSLKEMDNCFNALMQKFFG